MKFLELVLQNFGPYAGKQVIDLSCDEIHPIILFGGMNGGGKTTLMDAIRLVLYGQRAQCSTRGNLNYSDFLIQCINRHTPHHEDTRIELLFEHIEYNQIIKLRVVRHWRNPLKDGKDSLGILVKQFPDKGLAETWDEFIENILPLGISSLFLFDGEQVKELAELETPPPLVVEAIQSLLGLELVERLATDLEILTNRKRKEFAGAKELAEIEVIEQRLEDKQQEFDEIKQTLEVTEKQVLQAYQKYRDASDKFLSEGGKIAAERSQLEREQQTVRNQIQQQRDSLCELAAGVLPLNLIKPILQDAIAQGQAEFRYQQTELAQTAIQERDRNLIDYLYQLNLSAVQIEKIQVFLTSELSPNSDVFLEAYLNLDSETLQYLIQLLNRELPQSVTQSEDILAHISHLEGELLSKERQLSAAASPEIYEQLKNAVTQTQNQWSQLKLEQDSYLKTQRELEAEIFKTRKELSEYGQEYIQQENANHLIKSAVKVQDTLKIFKEKLTLKKLNKLEVQVTECFRYLLHKSDLVHRIVIDTHTFRLSLYDPQGQPVPKHRLSAGEKQLLAIALLWGLARVSGKRLPVAIDTPLGRLDSSHRHNLVERYFPAASHQVILLSTDTEIGQAEVKNLREQEAIACEYLLEYNSTHRQTTVKSGYFW